MLLPLGRSSSFLWTESLEEDRALPLGRGARCAWQCVPTITSHIPSATGCFSFTVFYWLQNSCLICPWENCLGRMAWESQLFFFAFILSGVPIICLALGYSCSEQGPQGVCCVLCRSDQLRNSALLKISLGVEGGSQCEWDIDKLEHTRGNQGWSISGPHSNHEVQNLKAST